MLGEAVIARALKGSRRSSATSTGTGTDHRLRLELDVVDDDAPPAIKGMVGARNETLLSLTCCHCGAGLTFADEIMSAPPREAKVVPSSSPGRPRRAGERPQPTRVVASVSLGSAKTLARPTPPPQRRMTVNATIEHRANCPAKGIA
jgi:hypothetical protein